MNSVVLVHVNCSDSTLCGLKTEAGSGEKVLNVRFSVPEAERINADKSHRRLIDVLILEYQKGHLLDGTGKCRTLFKHEVIHSIQTNQLEVGGKIPE